MVTDISLEPRTERYLWFVYWSLKTGHRHFTEQYCSDDYGPDGTVKPEIIYREVSEGLEIL